MAKGFASTNAFVSQIQTEFGEVKRDKRNQESGSNKNTLASEIWDSVATSAGESKECPITLNFHGLLLPVTSTKG